MLRAVVVALLLFMAPESVWSDETVEVELPQGRLQGVREKITDDRFYYSFRGIPFAKPPVGDLRFEDPVPAEPWNGLREGMDPPACPQKSDEARSTKEVDIQGKEDCLYLHVYTPQVNPSAPLPVMVYIHGGIFSVGNADKFGGTPKRLLTKDIVLVSIQYRLGTLGFMSTGDSVMPGNFGLKDQTLALKWVKDNIQSFGGDPERITIFGESAGGASVHIQTLTPYSKGLFNRVIMQSDTALSRFVLRDDHAEYAVKIGQDLNCSTTDSSSVDNEQLLDCFKKASVEDLVMAPQLYTSIFSPLFRMTPRVDGDYLPAHPGQLLREGKYHNVDIISGVCQNEEVEIILRYVANETLRLEIIKNFDTEGPYLTCLDVEPNGAYLAKRVFYHYLGEIDFTEDGADKAEEALSACSMTISHDEATSMHARDAKYGRHTYRYELQHRGERSSADTLSSLLNTPSTRSMLERGVAHGDDLQYLFNDVHGYSQSLNRSDDIFLSEIMVSLWTNFAKTGNPTPDMALGFKWEPMTSESDFRFLSLTPAPKMKEDNRKEHREFWRNMPTKDHKLMYPELFRSDTDTCLN